MIDEPEPFLLPEDELEERFVLAGGPGGKHINKAATAAPLRNDVPAPRH